ncbi:MAG: DUF465 domain-containing protein [Proteobacteria bacterium]|nr:DUF465 domain-containing protein [Pseudomonadota bacterium]
MEKSDIDIIQRHMKEDRALASLYTEHIEYERMLEKFNSKPFLTPGEEIERKNLQKKKLVGRDRMEAILRAYRAR